MFSPGQEEWQPISSTLDTEAKRLTAALDHFSGYAITTAQAERHGAVPGLPATVAGFQTDLFTGASTFVYPIQVAPGTAGMQPGLSLSYSSLAADQGWPAQAGWVGFGFNLDAGYIARGDPNETPDDPDDDTFHLVLNGVSSELVEESADVFHTEQETFWRIQRHTGGGSGADGGQYWVVTDTNGTEHRFGYTEDAAWNSLAWAGTEYVTHTYRYCLDRVRDVHGNDMTFEYEKEQEWLNDPLYAIQYDRAGYLWRIRYTGNDLAGLQPQREVVFSTVDREVANYPGIYEWSPLLSLQHFFLKKQLEAIEVRLDGQRVRRYVFGYHHEDHSGNTLYVDQRLLLDSITQLGSEGDTPLITTTFTYYDLSDFSTWQRLMEGSNNYGASVSYEYDSITLEDDVQRVRVVHRTVSDGGANHVYGYGYGTPEVIDEEFRGHDVVVVTLPNNESSKFYFNQGIFLGPLKGRLEKVKKYDDQDALQSTQDNDWWYQPTGGGASFVYLDETLTTVEPSDSIRVQYSYDDYGNLTQVYEPGDPNTTADDRYRVMDYTVNTADWIVNRPKTEEIQGIAQTLLARSEYTYDHHTTLDQAPEKGDLTKVVGVDLVNGNDLVTEYDHDAYGNVTDVTDGQGQTTTTTYDATYHTFPETVDYPVTGLSTTSHYDAGFGLVEQFTDLNGQTTHYEYDIYGRLRKVWAPLDYGTGTPSVEYVYTPTSSGLEVQTRRKETYGSTETYDTVAIYNGLGQLVQTTADGESGAIYVDYQYDGLGRQWRVSTPYTGTAQLWAETTYDALGRLERVTHTDGTYRQTTYTGWERVDVRDENGHYKGYSQDAFGRTVQVDEYRDGHPTTSYATTQYSYDLLGNLTGLEDDLGHTTVITYDSLGRKLAMDDPDMGDWSYTYDLNGNLETQTDAGGTVITFTYDALDRLETKTYSNGDPTVTYTYDTGTNGKGRRTGMTDASGTAAYTYDQQGRLLTETKTLDGAAYSTGFTYDPMDRVRTMTYPDGEVITYDYNDQGLLRSMGTSLGGNYVQNMTYNALGQTTLLQLGNELATTYDYYDTNFRLESVVTTGGLQDLSYTYDDVGNVQTMTDSVGGLNLTYGYDELDRLTGVSGTYGRTYSYNTIGNLEVKNGLTLYYEDADHPHAVSSTSGDWSLDYSPAGNLITKTLTGGPEIVFGYDAENRLTQVVSDVVGSVLTTTLVYDGNGRRVKKVDESGTTVYVGEHYEVRYSGGEQDWGTDIKVNDPGIEGVCPAIAADGSGNAYVVWARSLGWGDGGDIYADKLPAGSETWGEDTTVNDIPPQPISWGPQCPDIAVDAEGNAYALWDDDRYNPLWSFDILSAELAAGESGWGENLTVNLFPGAAVSNRYPAVAMDEDCNAYAVWASQLGIQLAVLPAGSNTWEGHTTISVISASYAYVYPAIAVDSTGEIHVVWNDGDIYYDHSTDGGVSWGADEKVNDGESGQAQYSPAIAVDGSGNVHVVWEDERNYPYHYIYYAKRGPSGWDDNICVESVDDSSSRPAIAVDGAGNVYAVWDHDSWHFLDDGDIYFASLAAGSSQWSAKTRVNDDTGYAQQGGPDIAVDGGGNVHVIWGDRRNDAADIYFDRLVSGVSEVAKHYYANGQRVATRVDGTLYYVHSDLLGSTVAVSDAAGQEVGRVQYDPYGEVLTSTLPVTLTDRLFTGQRLDSSTGLYYYNARYYDPHLGRFIQPDTLVPDPLNPQTWNRFSYVYNNPTSYVDPGGHVAWVPLLIFGGAFLIGAGAGGYYAYHQGYGFESWQLYAYAGMGGLAGVAGAATGMWIEAALLPVGATVGQAFAAGAAGGFAAGVVEQSILEASGAAILGTEVSGERILLAGGGRGNWRGCGGGEPLLEASSGIKSTAADRGPEVSSAKSSKAKVSTSTPASA